MSKSKEDKMVKLRNPEYPEGSLLFDVRYYNKPAECFEVILWNSITKQLEVYYEEPIIDIWFLKEEYRTNKLQISQAPIEQCYVVHCKPSQISKMIAENVGGSYKEFYDKYHQDLSSRELKDHMCKCPWVFKADLTPDVYYRLEWLKKHGDAIDISKITYGFVDIEVDVLDKSIDIKNIYDVTQPVNAVTVILPAFKICAVLILSPRPKHKLHSKFHNLLEKQKEEFDWLVNHQEEFKRMIVEEDEDNKEYLKGYDIRLHIFDFDREIDLIKTVFDYINKYRPWFCLSWNAKFDDNYLMNRIAYMGYDPREIIIPKEFKTSQLYYNEDKNPKAVPKTSRDWWFTSTYTQYLCQMRNFAAIRKSQQERRSLSLSSVGRDIAGIDKLTQTKSGTFREFAYTDFLKFILYNVRDVVVQLAIESKCNDCQFLYSRSYMFATQYSKCFQETHIVRNTREYYYEIDKHQAFVQACRLIVDPNLDTHFKGAFVAPTEKNAPTGLILNGKKVNNIIYAAVDADAESYYPNTAYGCNLDPMSLIHKVKIDNSLFKRNICTNRSLNQEYIWYDSENNPHDEDMSGPIMNSYKNNNFMSICHNWLNLPSVTDIFAYLDANL